MRIVNTEERIAKFPKDRVAFLPNSQAASRDKAVFSAYRNGQISIAAACQYIAANNGLVWITREQFLTEYNVTGWGYTTTEEDEDAIEKYQEEHGGDKSE